MSVRSTSIRGIAGCWLQSIMWSSQTRSERSEFTAIVSISVSPVVTISHAGADDATVNTMLNSLVFNNTTNNDPTNTARTVTLTSVTDSGSGLTADGTVATVNVTPVNDAPTLTTFVATADTGDEDTEIEISFAEMAAQGNEADVDGTVDAFVIKTVSTGTLKIAALAGDQQAKKTNTGGKAVLLKGGNFTAKFEVQSPAQQPPPGPGSPIPDATPQYSGNGMFITTNIKFQGS